MPAAASIAPESVSDSHVTARVPQTAPTSSRPLRVLLVEDNEDSMLLVKYALEEFGDGKYVLDWADRLYPGLERLQYGNVDVTLLDLGLPETNGPDTFFAVRNANPKVPVIVLTADECTQTEYAVTSFGADEYLVKGEVSGSVLANAISDVIRRRKSRGAHPGTFKDLRICQRGVPGE